MNRKWVVVFLVLLFIAVTYSFREGNDVLKPVNSAINNIQITIDLAILDNLGYDSRWNDLTLSSITNTLNYRMGLINTLKRLNSNEIKDDTQLTACVDQIIYKTSSSLCAAKNNKQPFDLNSYGVKESIELNSAVSMMKFPSNPTIKMITDTINNSLTNISRIQTTYTISPTVKLTDAKTKIKSLMKT